MKRWKTVPEGTPGAVRVILPREESFLHERTLVRYGAHVELYDPAQGWSEVLLEGEGRWAVPNPRRVTMILRHGWLSWEAQVSIDDGPVQSVRAISKSRAEAKAREIL